MDIYAQFRRPTGPMGWLVGQAMAVKNGARSRWALQQLAPAPGERILEVGFGSGADVVRLLAAVGSEGAVYGADASDVMVRQARRRSRAAVAAGRAVLALGTVEALPFEGERFDGVFSVNCAQFWADLQGGFRALGAVTRPGGRAVVVVQPRHRGATSADAERWRARLAEAASGAGWAVREALLGPGAVPPAAVVATWGVA